MKKYQLISLIVLLLAGCGTGSEIKKAETLFKAQKYDESRTAYQKIFDSKETPPLQRTVAGVALAQIHFLKKEYKKANAVLNQVISMNPPKKYAVFALDMSGTVLNRLRESEKSLERFEKLLRTGSESPVYKHALENAIEISSSLRKNNGAVNWIDKWTEIYPDDSKTADYVKLKGDILVQLERPDDAMDIYTGWLEIYTDHPARPDVIYWLGEYSSKHDQFETAVEYFNTLLDEYPGNMWEDDLLNWLGSQYFSRKDYEKSYLYFRFIIDKPVETMWTEDAYNLAVQSCLNLNKKDTAKQLFSKLKDLYPDSPYIEEINNLFK